VEDHQPMPIECRELICDDGEEEEKNAFVTRVKVGFAASSGNFRFRLGLSNSRRQSFVTNNFPRGAVPDTARFQCVSMRQCTQTPTPSKFSSFLMLAP
jgi:hypothetical protein